MADGVSLLLRDYKGGRLAWTQDGFFSVQGSVERYFRLRLAGDWRSAALLTASAPEARPWRRPVLLEVLVSGRPIAGGRGSKGR